MIFPVIIYILIGLAISSFIYGVLGDEFDGLYIFAVIVWPIIIIAVIIAVLIKLIVNVFYKLGEYIGEKFNL